MKLENRINELKNKTIITEIDLQKLATAIVVDKILEDDNWVLDDWSRGCTCACKNLGTGKVFKVELNSKFVFASESDCGFSGEYFYVNCDGKEMLRLYRLNKWYNPKRNVYILDLDKYKQIIKIRLKRDEFKTEQNTRKHYSEILNEGTEKYEKYFGIIKEQNSKVKKQPIELSVDVRKYSDGDISYSIYISYTYRNKKQTLKKKHYGKYVCWEKI